MKKDKKITAAELMAQLEANPEFVAKRSQAEREHQEREKELHIAETPLLQDLAKVGFLVDSVWALVNTADPYSPALPTLLEHLPREYPAPVREGIARALALPAAKFGRSLLISQYKSEQEPRVKDAMAAAIAATADDEVIVDIIALARDKRHGPSRLLLLSALECSDTAQAQEALILLQDDDELEKEITTILRRRKNRFH